MKCDELARVWPEKFPRPDAETTQNNGRAVRKFGRDFAYRDPASISREEALEWALANPRTARFVLAMFNDFQRIGLIGENVFAGLKVPAPGAEPLVIPSTAQVGMLINAARAADDQWLASMIAFAAFVGLRFAEQQAVLVPGAAKDAPGNALDASFKRLRIDWQRSRRGDLKRPKTKRGVRVAMVPERAREVIPEAALSRYTDGRSEFLWPYNRETHRQAWSNLRREAGIWFKWHNLRHHCATWLLDHGASIDDVAKQLGCRPEEVRKTYGHPDQEKALARLEGLIDG